MANSLFETKDLVVSSAMIAKCHDVSVLEYFIDYKNGKAISVTDNLDEAKGFAVTYQNLLDKS